MYMSICAYVGSRSDRAGSQIHDHLFAYAYCFSLNYTFMGAKLIRNKDDVRRLSKIINIPLLLPCHLKHSKKIDGNKYRSLDSELFTPNFLQHIRNNYTHYESKSDNNKIIVAVMIRRGDVNPKKYPKRYMYNQYYLDILEQIERFYMNKNTELQIHIYSESESYESFDDFSRYSLHLDTDIESVWKSVINADIMILSKSSFSYIPALYNKNLVIYYPFWHKKLNDDKWINSLDDNFKTILQEKLLEL